MNLNKLWILALISIAATPSFAATWPEVEARQSQTIDVVVIGGGLAGLAAVDALARKGITNVLLLESKDRVGGKMWTERPAESGSEPLAHYERGAELVNSSDLQLRALLSRFKVGLVERRFVKEEREAVLLFNERLQIGESGQYQIGPLKAFNEKELISAMNEISSDRQILQELFNLQTLRKSQVASERAAVQKKLRSKTAAELLSGGQYSRAFLDALFSSEFGFSTEHVNAEVLLDYVEVSQTESAGRVDFNLKIIPASDERYRIRGGTDSIIRKLDEAYQNEILKNAIATRIVQLAPDQFAIDAHGGPNGQKQVHLTAKNVIFAVPAYDLASMQISAPEVSAKELAVASRLPYASNAKIFLRFDKKFWDSPGSSGFSGVGILESGVQFWDTTENQRDSRGGVITIYPGDWPTDEKQQRLRLNEIIAQMKTLPAFRSLENHLISVDQEIWKKSYAGLFNTRYQKAPALFARLMAPRAQS